MLKGSSIRSLALLPASLLALSGCAHVLPPSGHLEAHAPAAGAKVVPAGLPTGAPVLGTVPDGAPVEASPDDAEDGDGENASADDGADPDDMEEFDGTILDLHDGPSAQVAGSPVTSAHSPLEQLSDAELKKRVHDDLESLGPMSLGAPSHGRLVNGVQMPKGSNWVVTDPGGAWGTQETIDNLQHAIQRVNADLKDTPKMIIGHISAKHGGHLSPHKSHQAGRDVDISYFYNEETKWYVTATEKNLDRARTWAFVKVLVKETPIDMIFMDTSIQKMLKTYALEQGEDPKWLDHVFQVGSKDPSPLVRYAAGHATHIHIRFFSPIAQASARIAAPFLPRKEQPGPDDTAVASAGSRKGSGAKSTTKVEFVLHRAHSGDTLDSLARQYGCSVQAIEDANGLKSNRIKDKVTYRIPKTTIVASSKSPGASRNKKK